MYVCAGLEVLDQSASLPSGERTGVWRPVECGACYRSRGGGGFVHGPKAEEGGGERLIKDLEREEGGVYAGVGAASTGEEERGQREVTQGERRRAGGEMGAVHVRARVWRRRE